ncbi:MAG: DUF1598 domain-containing protein [Pirellulales bacterium]
MSFTANRPRKVRLAVTLVACFAVLFVSSGISRLHAQNTNSSSSGGSTPVQPNVNPGNPTPGMPDQGAAGGGVVHDWGTVMMLISMMVDPDEWQDFGGTGTSRMIPYPNGVWIDPQGHIKRLQATGNMMPGFAAGAARSQWRAGSGLRTVSLKQLDAALAASQSRGLPATAEMLQLAGLSHIQYIAVDVENRDVLLAGPAGNAAGLENGFQLDDLRTLAALANSKTQPLGCSLDPQNAGIAAAQQFLADPKVIARLGSAPQAVSEQLKAKVGQHAVNVFGLDPNSGTALALVDADEHMKRVGLGLAVTTPKIKTYFDHLDRLGKAPAQSLIRWWFAYNTDAIQVNDAGNLFELPSNTVAVLSQQQFVNAQGKRQPTGGNDEAADAFAADMTSRLPALRASHPAYARLHGIFELSLALQLAIDSSKQESLAEWFPTLCYSEGSKSGSASAPKSVDGVIAWDRLKNGTVVAVISGGVTIEPTGAADRSNWVASSDLTHGSPIQAVPTKPSAPLAAQWWWD